MLTAFKKLSSALRGLLSLPAKAKERDDELRLLIGRTLSEFVQHKKTYRSLKDLEFKVFSQFGDDGIIQYLVSNLDLEHNTFIEFGVEDYLESNTRFLLQKDNWTGLVMDASEIHMNRLRHSAFFWKHDLSAKAAFVTAENINDLLAEATRNWSGTDLLHIDIDGNDYWIWDKINLNPAIVIVEYNSTFGIERPITIPYDPTFYRTSAHYSNLYWGTSLRALHYLATRKGYEFIGCNSAGNNAYFVRADKMNDQVRSVPLEQGFVRAKYRESRNESGDLTYLSRTAREALIKGMPVFDVEQGKIVAF
jgi:hypothetical protein